MNLFIFFVRLNRRYLQHFISFYWPFYHLRFAIHKNLNGNLYSLRRIIEIHKHTTAHTKYDHFYANENENENKRKSIMIRWMWFISDYQKLKFQKLVCLCESHHWNSHQGFFLICVCQNQKKQQKYNNLVFQERSNRCFL